MKRTRKIHMSIPAFVPVTLTVTTLRDEDIEPSAWDIEHVDVHLPMLGKREAEERIFNDDVLRGEFEIHVEDAAEDEVRS